MSDIEEKTCERCSEAAADIGKHVWCDVCPQSKKPWGRSAPMGSSYCDHDCPGYSQGQVAGDLWPGESRLDFGYGGAMSQPCTCESP